MNNTATTTVRYLILAAGLSLLFCACRKEKPQADTPQKPHSNAVENPQKDTVPQMAESDTLPKPIRAKISKEQLMAQKGPELEMQLVRPIYSKIFDHDGNVDTVLQQLTKGQKALYFSRKINDIMTEGGLDALLESSVAPRLPQAAEALREVGNEDMAKMAEMAYGEYRKQKGIKSPGQRQAPSVDAKDFREKYERLRDKSYPQLEEYIRGHASEFVELDSTQAEFN